MENEIYQIYDRIFKRIFALSNLAIINLINALFGTNHSQDSKITYLNKEFVARNLDKRFADIFLQINGITYHLEAQMTKSMNIIVRVFEYGFFHAMENREEDEILKFPQPAVIYLDTVTAIPETSTLVLDFGEQGCFEYKVKNFVYQEHKLQELNQKKMIILIPFQLLKLRKIVEKKPTEETWELLRKLILDDIIGSIKANLGVGNITESDATELKELTLDKYRIRIDELEQELDIVRAKAEEDKAKAETEIQLLKKKLADLQK